MRDVPVEGFVSLGICQMTALSVGDWLVEECASKRISHYGMCQMRALSDRGLVSWGISQLEDIQVRGSAQKF